MAEQAGANNFDFDDFAHQACYVFKPYPAVDEEIDDRPRKKRKTLKPKPTAAESWPKLCAGQELPKLAKLREQIFQRVWNDAQERIDQVINEIDDPALDNVLSFAQAGHNVGAGLRTALIVSASGNSSQKHVVKRWKQQEPGRSNGIAIELHSGQAPNLQTVLKNLIRTAIETHSSPEHCAAFLAENKRMIPMNYDLELLQQYVERNRVEQVLISVQDVETYDLSVLSDVLSSLASWTDRIPFVLLLGIATTIDLFESRLSKATIRLLDPQVFEINSQSNKVYDIFAAVQHHEDSKLFIDASVINNFNEATEDQSTTVESMIRMIKYCYMSHFFANPLSVLLDDSIFFDDEVQQLIATLVRHTSSFQAQCEILVPPGSIETQSVRRMLDEDDYLLQQARALMGASVDTHRQQLRTVRTIQALHANVQPKPTLSAFALEHLLLTQPLAFSQSPTFNSLLTLLRATPVSTIRNCLPDQPSPSTNPTTKHLATIFNDLHSTISDLPQSKPLPSNAFDQLHTSLSGALTSLQSHCNRFTNNISEPLQSPLVLHEAFIFNLPHPLRTTFFPRPRFALERALSRPADYLGCECCGSSHAAGQVDVAAARRRKTGAKLEPTAVLYALLEEAGREVNVRDLWDAFCARMGLENGVLDVDHQDEAGEGEDEGAVERRKDRKRKGKGKHGVNGQMATEEQGEDENGDEGQGVETQHDEEVQHESEGSPQGEEERHVLALFYRSLAELKMLGLVKSASSKMKGVDVIAKTGWKGL